MVVLCGDGPQLADMTTSTYENEQRAYAQRQRRQLQRALTASLALVALLGAVFFASEAWPWLRNLAIRPHEAIGLIGVIFAPLLHGDFAHLASNAVPLIILGCVLGTLYPRTAVRALPLIWLLSGIGTWAIGRTSLHLGASGITHGLFFLVFMLALLRRDRPAIAAGLLAFFMYGGMLLTVLPREWDISWEYHLSGALAGIIVAILWFRLDPAPPRKRYSWEDEELLDAQLEQQRSIGDPLEPSRPADVPVLWQRTTEPRGVVLPFRRIEQISPEGDEQR